MSEVMHAWPPRLPSLVRPRPAVTSLPHCLLLAALLHLWLVLVLGSAPSGTAEPGQGVWGAINVRLRGPVSDQPNPAPPPEVQPEGAPGQAAAARWGGAVRPRGPVPDADPGAARLGSWGPQAAAPAPQASPAEAVTPLPPVPAARPLPLPPATTIEARPVQRPEAALDPEPAEASLRTRLPAAGPQVEALAAAPAMPVRAATELAAVPVPAAAALAPQRLLGSSPVPSQPASLAAVPPLQAVPAATLPALDPVLPPAAVQPAPLRALRPAPVALASPQSPLARPTEEPGSAPLPEIIAPQPMPAMRPPLPEPDLRPMATDRPPATPVPAGPQPLPAAVQTPAPVPSLPAVPGPGTAADAGARVGHDVATPPSHAASAVPRLNLELSRPRGGELSRGSARGVLPVLPRPPELDEKLAREIQKAGKLDCRKAYADSGLLAVLPLAADALGKTGGCKW